MNLTRIHSLARVLLMAAVFPSHAAAESGTATLTLDGLSFLSFQDLQNYAIPSGSTLVMEFGAVQTDGSIPVTIAPSGVSIAPISVPGGGNLRYGLGSPAHGSLRRSATGAVLQFRATVTATLERAGGGGTFEYPMTFTTESAAASDASHSAAVSVEGARLDLGARYVQLVAATTNRTQAYPEPGKAVYTVLSGTFDRLPALPPLP